MGMNTEIVIESHNSQASRVMIGHHVLEDWPWSSWLAHDGGVLVVVDPQVQPQMEALFHGLRTEKKSVTVLTRTISEHDKTLETVAGLYQDFGENRVTRDTLIMAVGGGVLTDVTGYAAATYLRGLRWAAVPTTLLAQVDAAIGGKVAVNTHFGKNLVGAFHLPAIVAIDTKLLTSLPLREWRAGLGEVIKSALIAGGTLYDRVKQSQEPLGEMTPGWAHIIAETAQLKAEIVQADLYEKDQRMFLNFGHTAAHALENYFGYGTLSHGEAVGLGCLVALYLSERLLGLNDTVRAELKAWLIRWGLPTNANQFDPASLMNIMLQDKKARSYGLQWVLLEEIGKPRVIREIDPNLVTMALGSIGPGA